MLYPNRLLRFLTSSNQHHHRLLSTTTTTTPSNSKNFMVSTPIFYVNAAPHVGHLYSTLLADVLARWSRIRRIDEGTIQAGAGSTLFVTGTDEHGLKIQQSAEKSNQCCGEFVDYHSSSFRSLFAEASISYDRFIRTTEDSHCRVVTGVWSELLNRGYIYKGSFEGWYCASEEAFLEEENIFRKEKENGEVIYLSKETKQPVVWTSEVNYMFRLGLFQEKIIKWLEDENPITPEHKLNEILGYLKSETLRDISVSRCSSRTKWAITVPNDPSQTVYVWLDALFNYLTAAYSPIPSIIQHHSSSQSESDSSQESNEFDIKSLGETEYWPADYQIVGKDILRFHSIYWPAFLLALDLPLPKKIVAHGHWMLKNSRMSKSGKNVVDPIDLMQKYGPDAVRYYLISEGGIESDVSFSEDTLVARLKGDLAGGFGNTFLRIIPFLGVDKTVPYIEDLETISQPDLYSLYEKVDELFADAKFSRGVQLIIEQVKSMNKYINDMKPWDLPEDCEERKIVVYRTLEVLRVCSILLQPVVPDKASLCLDALGVSRETRQMHHTSKYRCFGEAVYPELLHLALFSLENIESHHKFSGSKKEKSSRKTDEKNKSGILFGVRRDGSLPSVPQATTI